MRYLSILYTWNHQWKRISRRKEIQSNSIHRVESAYSSNLSRLQSYYVVTEQVIILSIIIINLFCEDI